MDSSWFMEWADVRMVIDPWLVGSEVDGFRWLNEQWHTHPVVPVSELPPYDLIVISQSYSDHCHLPTLKAMEAEVPILSTAKAYALLGKKLSGKHCVLMTDLVEQGWTNMGEIDMASLHPGHHRDPVYFGLVIKRGDDAVLYMAHGFKPSAAQLEALEGLHIRLLITTFTEFALPKLMGGKVNPGLENVYELLELFKPDYVLNTHDEEKKARGLVSMLAKVQYPNWDGIELPSGVERVVIGYEGKRFEEGFGG